MGRFFRSSPYTSGPLNTPHQSETGTTAEAPAETVTESATAQDRAVKAIYERLDTLPGGKEEKLRSFDAAQVLTRCATNAKKAKIAALQADKAAKDAKVYADEAAETLGRLAQLLEDKLDGDALAVIMQEVNALGYFEA
jgi:hypothetical protein